MENHANHQQTKRSIDEIIEHMTADIQNNDGQYVPLGFTPPATPAGVAGHWSEYTTSAAVSHSYRPLSLPALGNTGENQVFIQDFPIHYDFSSSPHVTKQGEGTHHNYFYPTPQQPINMPENREMIGTVVDGEGNIVNVVYGNRTHAANSGGMMSQSYAAQDVQENVQHHVGSFMSYHQPGMFESNAMGNVRDYGLFGNSDAQQQPPPRQLAPQMHHQDPVSTNSHSRAQLIENLVGNWVPNQSGTYSPFGCMDNMMRQAPSTNQQGIQTVPISPEAMNDHKGVGRGIVRKARIVAEVRPMRMSYSDVLTKSVPQPPVSGIAAKSNTSAQNSGSKSDGGGKVKSSSGSKPTGGKKKNTVLKRQHSSGSDEQNGSTGQSKVIQSPGTTRKSGNGGVKNSFSSSMPRKWVSLDDLDSDKQNVKLEEGDFHARENIQKETNSSSKTAGSDGISKKTGGTSTSKSKQDDKWYSVGPSTLNNHKPTAYSGGGKGPGLGGSTAKRPPIHINNLGTAPWATSGATSQGGASVYSEKNVAKGAGGSSKNCKSSPDEKKGNSASQSAAGSKADAKAGAAGGGQGRSGPAKNGSGAPSQGPALSEKPSQGKRGQRSKKKEYQSPIALMCQPFRQHVARWGRVALRVMLWFLHLLSDVLGMSVRLSVHLLFKWLGFHSGADTDTIRWWQFWRRRSAKSKGKVPPTEEEDTSGRFKDGFPPGLENNISLPSTGEEAMKRLLACKGKDPYSILGVTPFCTDDDIKKYYKRQAFLVHPDKNNQPGAEEAFKILVHAFELIGEPERRKAYDRRVAETQQVEQAWSELSDLLSQLHQKMEYAANTIRCTNCGKRHRRVSVDRPCYAARECAQCKIRHAAREGDIWAESSMLGFLWHYYACMDGAVYDITEWAACQADNLRHLRANTHNVQYRIVLGKQQAQAPSHHSGRHRHRAAHDTSSEPDLEDFLNNLYSQPGGAASESTASHAFQSRCRKKGKRKK
ncbi:uncharacterized protein LOC134533199 isoform X2 [Bacillus rossius redtenbacheri]|uniref:uncharacterized protein LOC134533199 isoform X2 n=1 Tax=Bacillus rossius redtenbacheri TaxID=93214 RepID=UPI002FDD066B